MAEQIESDNGLREDAVPEIEREIAVRAAEAGDEVVFNVRMARSAALRRWT